MPDYLGDDQRKTKEEDKDDAPIRGNKHLVKLRSLNGVLCYEGTPTLATWLTLTVRFTQNITT